MEPWRTPAVDDLCDALLAMRTRDEMAALVRDLCTVGEIEILSHRLEVARLLSRGLPYAAVADRAGASTTTVTRLSHWATRVTVVVDAPARSATAA